MADTDSHSLHANKSRITSSLKQHFISMVKDFIPLGTHRRASVDSNRRALLPKPEASSWSQAPARALPLPSPTCLAPLSYQKDPRRRTGPLFPRSSSQPDANMLTRSSSDRHSRATRRREFSPAPDPKRQQSAPANTRNPGWMAPSRNFRSTERKSSEASPKKEQAVHGDKLSIATPKKDSHEASGSTIKTSPTKMQETLQKLSRDGSSLQPRLVLKRLRDSDLESLGEVKRPCLNDNHQTHTQTHISVNPGLSPPPTARSLCTSSNSTRPQTEEALISTVLAQCELTHTSTELTLSETITTHTSTSTTTNTTEPETKPKEASVDFAQSKRTDTSGNKSQPASKPTYTSASQMAHISTNITRPSSAPTFSPTRSTPSSFPNQGHTPRPLQPRHTFSPNQPSRPTFHPTLSSVPRYRHTPRPTQPSHTYSRAPGPTFLPPRHTHTPARHPSILRMTPMPSGLVPRPCATFALSPMNPASRLTSSHTSLRPMFRPMQQHVSSPTHRPTNSVARHTHNYTSTNAVSRPTPTPTKPVSTLTKTPIPASPSRSTDSSTPSKPVSTLTKTLTPASPSRSTDSHTPTKPVSSLTNPPTPASPSRSTDSHTPTKPVSSLTNPPTPASPSRSTDSQTPTKPLSTLTKTPTPANPSKTTDSHTPTKPVSTLTIIPAPASPSRSTDSHTPTKPVSSLTKTPTPASPSRSTDSHTPTKPVSSLTKTPTPASPSRSTDSHTPTKPVSTLTIIPAPASPSRSTDSHTPTKPVSSLTKTPTPASPSRSTDSHTPTKPVSSLTKTPTPASPSRSTDSHTPTKPVSTLIKILIAASRSRSMVSHTPTKPVSTLTKTPTPANTPRSTDSHTPTKPLSTLTKTPIPTNSASRAADSHTPTKSLSTPRNTSTNPVSGPAQTCRPLHPFFQSKQTHARPLRHLAPSPPPGVADAKQPRVTPSPSTATLFTPPKFVQRAFIKCNEGGPLIMKEKCSPRLPTLSEPSSSSSSSSSSFLPAASVKSSSRKLFAQADSTVGPGETTESSGPQPTPLNPPQPYPIPSDADPPGSDPPVQAPWSPSPQMDNLDEILTPDSPPAAAGMDVDMVSPEASQDSPVQLTSQIGTLAQTDVVLDEADTLRAEISTLKAEISTLKAEPSTNESPVCSGQDSFGRTQVPSSKASPAHSLEVLWVDPLEDELGLGDGLDCAMSDTSSSEDEKLLSLQEIMERMVGPPPTPDKDAFSEPSTPVAKAPVEPIRAKAVNYKNTLEQMLIEKEQNKKSKELEEKLLQCCQENLLMMAEEEEEKEKQEKKEEEEISHEQNKFVQKYTMTSSTIRDLHPGEELFSLASFGRLFTQDSLLLPSQGISPKNAAQRSFLRASPKQALLLVGQGLLKRAYASSPCQPEVSRWLLQMMSVHSDPWMSAQILQSLKHIALIAGLKIESQDLQFQVWVPSVQDVVLVFLNMGVPYISMFPLEMLQPPFTEADLLENTAISPECAPSGSEHAIFPEHNFDNVIKYLSVCAALCPRVYSDGELLLLLALVCRLSLDTHLQLLPTTNLSTLLLHLITNITDWNTQLPLVCRALTDLTEDHHNLRRLVQLLPPSSRGRELRRHLSLSIISRLLNHRCTYKPASTEFQLSDLRRYVPRMRPSLLKHIAKRPDMEQDESTLDQQAYYLCYSLLDLTNEASNYEFLRPDQKNQLKMMSVQLEKHVKCDIRESEKCLYRSKVKDYVARIYTRWHVLLQRTRPAQGKLYDFWEPLSEDAVSSSQEEQQEQRRPQPDQEEQQEQRQPQPDQEEQQEQRRPQPDQEEQQEQRQPQPDQEEQQEQRRPQPDQEEQQEQRRPQPDQEEQQEQRRPQPDQEEQQEQRRPQPDQEEQQEQRRPQPDQEEQQEQRRPQQQDGKENVAKEAVKMAEEAVKMAKEALKMAEEEPKAPEEEMGDESSRNKTVMEEVTMMEQPEKEEEPNREQGPSAEEGLGRVEGQLTEREGLPMEGEELHLVEKPDQREGQPTKEGLDRLEGQPPEEQVEEMQVEEMQVGGLWVEEEGLPAEEVPANGALSH